MDNQYTEDFFESLIEILQGACTRFLKFRDVVELNGYMCVEIDSRRKEVYVLRERIAKSGSVTSESYCTHVLNTPVTCTGSPVKPDQLSVEAGSVPLIYTHATPTMVQPMISQQPVPCNVMRGSSQTVTSQQPVPSRVLPVSSQTVTSQQPVPPRMLPVSSQTLTSQQPVPSRVLPVSSQTVTSQQPVPPRMLPVSSQTVTSQQPVPSRVLPVSSQTLTSQQPVPSRVLPGSSQTLTSQQPVPPRMLPVSSQTVTSPQPVPPRKMPGPSRTVTSQQPVPSRMLPGSFQTVTSQQQVPSRVLPGSSQTVTSQQPVSSRVLPGSSQTLTSQQPVPSRVLPVSSQTLTSQQPVPPRVLPGSSQTLTSQQPVPSRVLPVSSQTLTSQQSVPPRVLPGSSQTPTSQQPVPPRVLPGSSQTLTSPQPVPPRKMPGPSQTVTSVPPVVQVPSVSYVLAQPQLTIKKPKGTHNHRTNPKIQKSTSDGKPQQGATPSMLSNPRQGQQTSLFQPSPVQPFPVFPDNFRPESCQSILDDIVDLVPDSLMHKLEAAEQDSLSRSHVLEKKEKRFIQDFHPLPGKGPICVLEKSPPNCRRSIHTAYGKEEEPKVVPDSNTQKSVINKTKEDASNLIYLDYDGDDSDNDEVIDLDLFDDDIYSSSMDICDEGHQSKHDNKGNGKARRNQMSSVNMMMKFHQSKTGKTVDLLSVGPKEIESMLLEYFKGAISRNRGVQLSPTTMKATLYSVRRFLRDKGYSFLLTKDLEFRSVKQYISSLSKSVSKTKTLPLNDHDIEILFQTNQLGDHDLLTLTYSMWFVNSRYLALQRPAEHFKLKWGDVVLKMDHQGCEYLARSVRADKVYKVYAKPETPDRCFVTLYKHFRERRPKLTFDESQPFYLKQGNQGIAQQNMFKTEALSVDFLKRIWEIMLVSSGLPAMKKICLI